MTTYQWPNLATMMFDQARAYGDNPFVWEKRAGAYQALSWSEVATQIAALARCLKDQGIEPGDRVAVVCENRPMWLISDFAIMAIGAITVPAYITNTVDDHFHILSDSGAKAAIVSNARLSARLIPALDKSPEVKLLIALDPPDTPPQSAVLLEWDRVIDDPAGTLEETVALARTWSMEDTACLIYTSGTGGKPKGVMLNHRSQFHNALGATDALTEIGLGDDVFLSFLPLSHSYEHVAGHFFPISIGAQIYYAEGIESLSTNMAEASPTIMTAVPRLYETMYQRITQGVKKSGGLKEKMFMAALELGRKRYHGEALGLVGAIQDRVLDKLVRDKVRGRFGGRLKALVSGGAPLNPDIGIFFTALGLRLLQGYGQTETAPVISVNRPSLVKMHTVGPPLLNTEVKIADDGEILVRGDLIMQGYWRDEAATRETIRDGWVHTGDIGHFDEDGYLVITDRKKDILVNSGGDNIAPQRIEGLLTLQPEIAQAMVYGDKRPHLVGLIVPDKNWLQEWVKANDKPETLDQLAGDADLHKALRPAVDRVNGELSNIEKIRRFLIARDAFTIDNEQMTPTMKARRHKIKEVYGDQLEKLYR
ncbi:MAG: long-chain fatty acid--CoA ligase [Rhodospirillales bacterium]|nr:long-chain fatty acid--CoA ligase [Rhodospirillales bacterium]